MINNFIGREKETALLDSLLEKKTSSLVVIKGRRRIGKSSLVRKFGEQFKYFEFSGLPPLSGITPNEQKNEFSIQLSNQSDLPEIKTDDWTTLFKLLASQCKKGRVIILLDEITWMANTDPTFLAKLKNVWDLELKHNPKLVLILCGSISTWIEKNIISSTGYLGRISLIIHMEELSLQESFKLLDVLGFKRSPLEKFIILSLTGGVPWYIEQVRKDRSALENISLLCFQKNAILLNEFNRVFHDLFGNRSEAYENIVNAISRQNLSYEEIANHINYSKGSVLTEYIEDLITSGFVSRNYSWDLNSGIPGPKLVKYRLTDNYLRFYFRYINPKTLSIKSGRMDEISPDTLPGWDGMLGLQFENLMLKNEKFILSSLHIKPEEVIQAGSFYQPKTTRQKGCQVDLLIQTKLNTLYVCEIKFSRKKLGKTVINDVQEKIARMSTPRNFAIIPVLIYSGEICDSIEEAEYFGNILDVTSKI